MKEFMLMFKEGQEYLISERKLRWTYQHGISSEKYRKDVDRELTVRQWEIIRGNPDNGYYGFYYNGVMINKFAIDTHSDPNLVMIAIDDPFPGYAEGHQAYSRSPYNPKISVQEAAAYRAKTKPVKRFFEETDNGRAFTPRLFEQAQVRGEDQQIRGIHGEGKEHKRNDPEGERSDHHYQQPHPRFQPTSEHVRRSESLLCKGETSLSYVDLLIRESIQVIPLEMVRIDKPAVVVVRVPETGEENRYMMTLSPIAKS